MKFAILGCGNMAGALLRGALDANQLQAQDVAIIHPKAHRREQLSEQYGVQAVESIQELPDCRTILVGVKPYQLTDILGELGPQLSDQHLLISVAAGWSVADLREALGQDQSTVARAMPNTPVQVRKGVSAWCSDDSISDQQREEVDGFFGAVGTSVELAEKHMDVFTALCGSGPAYVCMILEGLIDAAVKEGLPRDQASTMACAMVEGAAAMAVASDESVADLRARVTSPGGTTAAGCAALEHAGIRPAMFDAITAAAQRSRSMK